MARLPVQVSRAGAVRQEYSRKLASTARSKDVLLMSIEVFRCGSCIACATPGQSIADLA
jgi:hypothetical protein